RISTLANQREPDSALKTSKLYTGATVVSAGGLFCGALAILLPILSKLGGDGDLPCLLHYLGA
ncbi:MAG: hypothetical protein V3S24_20030, partial [Candidatus Tectomicrobia bacterium]